MDEEPADVRHRGADSGRAGRAGMAEADARTATRSVRWVRCSVFSVPVFSLFLSGASDAGEVQRTAASARAAARHRLHRLQEPIAIDYGRCVACMDCLDACRQGAVTCTRRHKADAAKISARNPAQRAATPSRQQRIDTGRRRIPLATAALAATASAVKAQEKKVDGGLAVIEDKKIPARATADRASGRVERTSRFAQHCTACQLCVSVCPNGRAAPFDRPDDG